MSYFFIRCELEGHAVSPDTGLDIEIVETIDYQDFFEVFFSNCPNAPMSSLIPSSLMDHILNATLFRKITITQRLTMMLIAKVPLGERSFLPEPYLVCAGRTMDRKLQPVPDAVE